MSAGFKFKYEIINIIRDNIFKGLSSFGLPLKSKENPTGWDCMESDQQSFVNIDRTVCISLQKVERVGWQSARRIYDESEDSIKESDHWLEQQTWEIKIILKRSIEPASASTITTFDVSTMLVSWFNRLGCNEFRKHNCSNLFIQTKDIKVYKDTSDVSQQISSFPLKLHVDKRFTTTIQTADVSCEGMLAV